MDIMALENHSDTNRGTMIAFSTTAVGANLATQNVVTIAANVVTLSQNTVLSVANTSIANTKIANTYVFGSSATTTGVQTTSRTTSVYANGTSGVIVAYNASAFMHATQYVFTVYNSSILHPSDIVITTVQSTNCPVLSVSTANTRTGSFDILVENSAGAGNDAAYTMNLNFGIIRVGS